MSVITPSAYAVRAARSTPVTAGDLTLWPLSVAQYHAMVRAGVLDEDDPVELLEGCLVYKMPKNPPHSVVTQLVADTLRRLLPTGWHVLVQEPITLGDSEPEPDIAVVRGALRDYLGRHPDPADLALVVEVADSTLRRDRGTKRRIYARAGIGCYWIVNLQERQLEVYTEPSGLARRPAYGTTQVWGEKAEAPVVLAGVTVGYLPVQAVLP